MYVLIPLSLHLFFSFQFDGIQPLLSANEYLNFTLNAVLSSVILFQIPLLVLLIDFIHPLAQSSFLNMKNG
jgi:Sec-independent protein secretion pathway component TatC